MVDTTTEKFGLPIQFKNSKSSGTTGYIPGANEMVSKFVQIKNNYRFDLKHMAAGNAHALRYYCENDCAYIFDVKYLKAIVEAIDEEGKGDGCMVLFQGLRREENDSEEVEKFSVCGRPTIIATAYAKSEKGLTHLKVKSPREEKLLVEYDAFEHPGDGSSHSSLSFSKTRAQSTSSVQGTDEYKPIVLDPSDEETAFTIKEIIPWDIVQNWF